MTQNNAPNSPRATTPVLVVDDEFLIRWSLRTRLAAQGYDVIEAGSIAEARAAFGKGVQVIVLDVRLPDGSGLELLAEILAARPSSRVILISAHGTADMAQKARASGAFEFLHKPFDLNVVSDLVDRAAQCG
jgi:DNA-binding NtrC family response regulator